MQTRICRHRAIGNSAHSFDKPRRPIPTLAERAIIAQQARYLLAQHMANARITRELKNNTPPTVDTIFIPGDRVNVWREKNWRTDLMDGSAHSWFLMLTLRHI